MNYDTKRIRGLKLTVREFRKNVRHFGSAWGKEENSKHFTSYLTDHQDMKINAKPTQKKNKNICMKKLF
jgi:hypothetical protein